MCSTSLSYKQYKVIIKTLLYKNVVNYLCSYVLAHCYGKSTSRTELHLHDSTVEFTAFCFLQNNLNCSNIVYFLYMHSEHLAQMVMHNINSYDWGTVILHNIIMGTLL